MPKQTILWTTLPNGVSNEQLQLSVFVSPRLQPNTQKAPLSEFTDFVDWPSVIKPMSFSVEFENGPTIQATRVSPDPDSELWTALFSNTFVESYTFDDYSNQFIHSYPVMNVLSTLKQVYQSVAIESPNSRPKIVDLMTPNRLGQVANIDRNIEWIGWVDQLRKGEDQGAVPPGTPDVPKDFLQTKWFHRPPGPKTLQEEVVQSNPNVKGLSEIKAKYSVSKKAKLPDPHDFAEMIDFHKIISSVGEFPKLMRSLGLVVDLQVALQDDIPTASRIWVVPNWNPSIMNGAVPPPKTAYSLSAGDGQFVARSKTPNDPEIVRGMLKLNDPEKYNLVQVDVDGLALKAMNFADNMERLLDPDKPVTSVDTPDDAGLPSLRSTGLSIVRTGRAFKQALKFKAAKDKNDDITSQKDTTLFAEDLVRGFRIDVWDSKTSQWHSLCRRRGTYHIKPNIKLQEEDEGIVSASLTGAADGSSDDFYMHESLFHWDGWSLCAPRPGGVIKPDDTVGMPSDNGQHPGQFRNEAPPGMSMETTFSVVPGSLPRLRFGVNYRLRARAVDLAGNSLGYWESDLDFFNTVSAVNANNVQLPYLRFEPVGSPILVLRHLPGAGESLERIAIRSNNDDQSKDTIPTTDTTDLHVAPPKTSQMTAELHSMFDDPNTGDMKKDAGTYNMIAQKDEGKWGEPPEGEFTIRSEAQLSLPYLPDPLAFGATFRNLPGETGKFRCIPFGSPDNWPDIQPFRLKLEEGNGAPSFNNGVLTVQLAKAEVARVRYSSYFRANEVVNIMGVMQWIAETNPANLQALLNSARNGLHWMLTPYRELVLVHAVQQPLLPLEIEELGSRKNIGRTFAELDGIIAIHGKSSDKMDLMAEWEEPVDDPSDENNNPAEDKLAGQGRAFEAKINLSIEYMQAGGGRARYVDGSQKLYLGQADPDYTGLLSIPSPRHEFGDTKYRHVRYRAIATTRFREYFDTGITSVPENITRKSSEYVVDILNSARPASPKLLYAIPTFGWEEMENKITGEIISQRIGGGLRVYMERPWFSSGDGELLGVVLWPTRAIGSLETAQKAVVRRSARVTTPVPDEALPYVTQWGMDPIWGSNPTRTRLIPSMGQFKNAKKTMTGLSLDELPGIGNSFTVVGYEVHYDTERQLWYSDIEVDPGDTYYPFIRMALARFQPNSIENAHLSRVVLADFVQLTPDRTVTMTRQGDSLNVLLSGVSYSKAPVGGKHGKPESRISDVKVTLESRDIDTKIEDEDLGWVPVSTPKAKLKRLSRKGVQARRVRGWEWNFKLPDSGGQKEFRILIKEYEVFLADDEPRQDTPLPPGSELWTTKEERRLVYAHSLRIG